MATVRKYDYGHFAYRTVFIVHSTAIFFIESKSFAITRRLPFDDAFKYEQLNFNDRLNL